MSADMAALKAAYDHHMEVACADPYDHYAYKASQVVIEKMTDEVYGELAEYAREWWDDCNEVPTVAELGERWLTDWRHELEQAAVTAAHATDIQYSGTVNKEPVVDAFNHVMHCFEQMRKADPALPTETLEQALLHGMINKALDYGVKF
jgi:hypothetical protein